MKSKIIIIYDGVPPYGIFPSEFWTKLGWKTPAGEPVWVWENNFLHLLGREVLKLTREFDCEVWQPDLKADKIYSHTFECGLVHKTFPSTYKSRIFGVKIIKEVYSKHILNELAENLKTEKFVCHINGSLLSVMNKSIIRIPGNNNIVFSFHGVIYLPSVHLSVFCKNLLSKINDIIENISLKRYINNIKCITYQNEKNIGHLKRIYKGELRKITMGCDFSFWRKLNQRACRSELGLAEDRFIMISSCRIIPLKQIDKFIKVLVELNGQYDFEYIVVGCGEERYENYLKQIAKPLLDNKKIIFTGYKSGETLLKYLNSADLYVLTSRTEGGVVSVMEAFACELPVFSTKTGHTGEVMEKEKAGCLVEIDNQSQWKEKIENMLKTRQLPKIMDRAVALQYYDWKNIAQKFTEIYKRLI